MLFLPAHAATAVKNFAVAHDHLKRVQVDPIGQAQINLKNHTGFDIKHTSRNVINFADCVDRALHFHS